MFSGLNFIIWGGENHTPPASATTGTIYLLFMTDLPVSTESNTAIPLHATVEWLLLENPQVKFTVKFAFSSNYVPQAEAVKRIATNISCSEAFGMALLHVLGRSVTTTGVSVKCNSIEL